MLSWGHMFLDQDLYLGKLRPIKPAPARANITSLQSSLVMSYTCADVICLQREMISPRIEHAKSANKILAKAIRDRAMNSLHFHFLAPPSKLQMASDASQARSKTVYAQEGKMVALMTDHVPLPTIGEFLDTKISCSLTGFADPLLLRL